MIELPILNKDELSRKAPQVDYTTFERLVAYINDRLSARKVPLFIYLHPDVEKLANDISAESKSVYLSLNFLAGYYSTRVKHELIFDLGTEIYKLQEPDIEELGKTKRFYNPYNPKEIFENAEQQVRRAFVISDR